MSIGSGIGVHGEGYIPAFGIHPLTLITLFNDPVTKACGIAQKWKNGTGSASVKGTLVAASTTEDLSFVLQQNEFDTIGVVLESGVDNGEYVWVQTHGDALCLLANGSGCTRGQLAIASSVDGRFSAIDVPSTNPVVGEHFKEIGHVRQSVSSGTNKLALVSIHPL